MTDTVLISIVTGLCAVLTSAISAYFAYKAKTIATETHQAVNSRMDEFKRMAQTLFRAEGVAQEKGDEGIRQAAASAAHAEGVAAEQQSEKNRNPVPPQP